MIFTLVFIVQLTLKNADYLRRMEQAKMQTLKLDSVSLTAQAGPAIAGYVVLNSGNPHAWDTLIFMTLRLSEDGNANLDFTDLPPQFKQEMPISKLKLPPISYLSTSISSIRYLGR